jgi:RNA methyltransferase, TrmH family
MTSRIDAASNPRVVAAVQAVKSGQRMLLEGRRMIEEALDAGVQLKEVFFQSSSEERREEEDLLRRLREAGDSHPKTASARVTEVAPRVIRRLSDLPSARGVVALAEPPNHTLASLSPRPLLLSKKSSSSSSISSSPLFLLLDEVQDPANVGAILRSAEAFGVAAAMLTPGCAWPFSPRALRASAGSAFRLPVVARLAATEAIAFFRANGIALAGAEARGGSAAEAVARTRPLALAIGSEGHGFSAEVAAALDHRVTLPLGGRVESLNAAVAAGVLLHILTRSSR